MKKSLKRLLISNLSLKKRKEKRKRKKKEMKKKKKPKPFRPFKLYLVEGSWDEVSDTHIVLMLRMIQKYLMKQ